MVSLLHASLPLNKLTNIKYIIDVFFNEARYKLLMTSWNLKADVNLQEIKPKKNHSM